LAVNTTKGICVCDVEMYTPEAVVLIALIYPVQGQIGVSSALGFPSKTSAEIAPDHRKLPDLASGLNREDRAQTRINIAPCKYWWHFHDALENGGNRFPLPAPQISRCAAERAVRFEPMCANVGFFATSTKCFRAG
jgi:hypothetical protein